MFALVGLFFPAAVTLLTYTGNQRMGPPSPVPFLHHALFALSGAIVFLAKDSARAMSSELRHRARHAGALLER